MSKEQWGHGYHTGKEDAKLEYAQAEILKRFDQDYLVEQVKSLLTLLVDYHVSSRSGGYDTVYYGLLATIHIVKILEETLRNASAPQ